MLCEEEKVLPLFEILSEMERVADEAFPEDESE